MFTDIKNKIIYNSKIDITFLKNDTKIKSFKAHNNATSAFFKTLCSLLAGQSTSDNLPSYLDVGLLDGSDFTSNLSSLSIVNASLEAGTAETGPVVCFRGVINYAQVLTLPSGSSGTEVFVLKDRTENRSILATIELDKFNIDSISTLSAGTSIIVEWRIYFK